MIGLVFFDGGATGTRTPTPIHSRPMARWFTQTINYAEPVPCSTAPFIRMWVYRFRRRRVYVQFYFAMTATLPVPINLRRR